MHIPTRQASRGKHPRRLGWDSKGAGDNKKGSKVLHKNVIEQKSGFRSLDDVELEAISGGRIVVIGDLDDGSTKHRPGQFFSDLAGVTTFDANRGQGAATGVPISAPPSNGAGNQGGEISGNDLLDKVPATPDTEDLLDEREELFALELELLGVPGPLAIAIAATTGTLSSVEFKQALNNFVNDTNRAVNEFLFGPPAPTTGNPIDDQRRALGPIVGPAFPE